MRKAFLPVFLILSLMGTGWAVAEGLPASSLSVSKRTFDLIRQLAQKKEVVSDIEEQNHDLTDDAKAQEIQGQWLLCTELSQLVNAYRDKPSCREMRDCFSKEISLVDCFTLDAQGRVVGTLYKTHDFLQDQDPWFVHCFNHGKGRVYVNQALPMLPGSPVEISMPVTDGSKTVGVLVATVLSER